MQSTHELLTLTAIKMGKLGMRLTESDQPHARGYAIVEGVRRTYPIYLCPAIFAYLDASARPCAIRGAGSMATLAAERPCRIAPA